MRIFVRKKINDYICNTEIGRIDPLPTRVSRLPFSVFISLRNEIVCKMNREDHLLQHTKQDPKKHCAYCGKEMHRVRFVSGRLEDMATFMRRKYCNRDCMRRAYVKTGQDTGQLYRASHSSAEKLAYLILGKEHRCEKCGSTKSIDVHHIDGNRNNNTPENIMVLCRSCHMKGHNTKGVCVICGEPMKGHGYCNKHYIRWKKFGNPLMYYHKIVDE